MKKTLKDRAGSVHTVHTLQFWHLVLTRPNRSQNMHTLMIPVLVGELLSCCRQCPLECLKNVTLAKKAFIVLRRWGKTWKNVCKTRIAQFDKKKANETKPTKSCPMSNSLCDRCRLPTFQIFLSEFLRFLLPTPNATLFVITVLATYGILVLVCVSWVSLATEA